MKELQDFMGIKQSMRNGKRISNVQQLYEQNNKISESDRIMDSLTNVEDPTFKDNTDRSPGLNASVMSAEFGHTFSKPPDIDPMAFAGFSAVPKKGGLFNWFSKPKTVEDQSRTFDNSDLTGLTKDTTPDTFNLSGNIDMDPAEL